MTDSAHFWADVLWTVLGLGLVAYALTGGADFGAGLWSLLASGPRKEQQRRAIHHAIAPIWEANHVWLIFVIVVMFTAFPRAFSVIGVALHVPIGLALVGIVLRGAAFSFHAYGIQSDATRERWSRVFAWSSAVTPLLLGTIVAALSSGAIRVDATGVTSGYSAGFSTGFACLTGAFVLALFALLSACYLAAETDGDVSNDFRKRGLWMEGIAGVLAASVFLGARSGAPMLHAGLERSDWSIPVQLATALFALLTVAFLVRRKPRYARWTVAAQVALVVAGWGLAMDHHFVIPDITIATSGSRPEVFAPLALVLGGGALLLGPALFYLYRVFNLRPPPKV